MYVINLRVKNTGGWLGVFSLYFPWFGFLKIQLLFFKGKIEVHASEVNGKIQMVQVLF